MPIFRYKSYRENGKESSGTIEADGPKDAALKIKSLGLFPRDITSEALKPSRKPGLSALPFMTRQLATMLTTGVPLLEALRTLSDESSGRWSAVFMGLSDKVAQGASLSRAMEDYPSLFPEFMRSMVEAGEASGSLDASLSGIADFLEKQSSTNAKVRSAMIYPVIMASVGFIVLSFIFAFVMPKLVRIFEDTKSSLPLATKILIFVSNFFLGYWWLILGAAVAAVYALRKMKSSRRLAFDALLLRLPGKILQSLYCFRFAKTLALLLEGGLPMLKALELAGRSVGNEAVRENVEEGARKVAEGARLSSSLEGGGFPPVFLQLIQTGEKAGTLSDVLKKAASSYEEEFTRRLDRAVALIEPAMILLMGGIVGFIVFSVLLPIFELNRLIK
jgi:general secretion pathway protein F